MAFRLFYLLMSYSNCLATVFTLPGNATLVGLRKKAASNGGAAVTVVGKHGAKKSPGRYGRGFMQLSRYQRSKASG